MSKENPYCVPSDYEFPRWNGADILIWKLMRDSEKEYTGDSYLYLYKDAYVRYHKNLIIQYAHEAGIPPLLLASIAWQEAGGKPDRLKPGVLLFRQFMDFFKSTNTYSNSVSVGIIAIQIRAAAEALGIDPKTLSTTQQLQLSRCLQYDDFNIKIAALHLRDLILYDYPGIDLSNINTEQFILAGSRYNRGIQRNKSDFLKAIHLDENAQERVYISYGLAIIKRKERVRKLIGQ